jgi:DNA-binding transcriptional LysR family regulator
MLLSERIGRRMKLQDLHVLMTVVQAGSMRKAAAILNTTQPTISRSIADLEHAVGASLLERHRTGVEPTEYGRALLDGGTAMFDELHQAVKKIESLADPETGEVRIGCGFHIASSFVTAVADRLSARYPRITFQLLCGETTDQMYRDLKERKVDLLIARAWMEEDGTFEFEKLFEDAHYVISGSEHPWARRRKIEVAELPGASWVLPPKDSPPGAIVANAFAACGLDYPRTTLTAVLPEARVGMLATGRFLTVFPTSVLEFPTKRPGLRRLPVALQLATIPIGIVTLKGRTTAPATKLFMEQARTVTAAMRKRR